MHCVIFKTDILDSGVKVTMKPHTHSEGGVDYPWRNDFTPYRSISRHDVNPIRSQSQNF